MYTRYVINHIFDSFTEYILKETVAKGHVTNVFYSGKEIDELCSVVSI